MIADFVSQSQNKIAKNKKNHECCQLYVKKSTYFVDLFKKLQIYLICHEKYHKNPLLVIDKNCNFRQFVAGKYLKFREFDAKEKSKTSSIGCEKKT